IDLAGLDGLQVALAHPGRLGDLDERKTQRLASGPQRRADRHVGVERHFRPRSSGRGMAGFGPVSKGAGIERHFAPTVPDSIPVQPPSAPDIGTLRRRRLTISAEYQLKRV